MDDAFRTLLEEAVMRGPRFSADPTWFFVFLERCDITKQLFEMISLPADAPCEAVVAFSKYGDIRSANDASAALSRMAEAASAHCSVQFSEELTLFFSTEASARIAEAFGVPKQYVCDGSLLFAPGTDNEDSAAPRWNVFSYIRE